MTEAIRAAQAAATPESQRRLHNMVYSVVYPAFLGSFIFALLQSTDRPTNSLAWGILLAVYFTLQQIEGSLSGDDDYHFLRAAADGVEIASMIAAYDALGLVRGLAGPPVFGVRPPLEAILFAVFAWPAIVRFLGVLCRRLGWCRSGAWGKHKPFYWCLTGMSALAAFFSIWPQSFFALPLVAALLALYLIAFQIWNDPVTTRGLRRPSRALAASAEESAVEGADAAANRAIAAAEVAAAAAKAAESAGEAAGAAGRCAQTAVQKMREEAARLAKARE